MIWIDRLALLWAGLIFVVLLLLANGNGHAEAVLDIQVAKAILLLAGGPWLVLRGLYFVATGRIRVPPRY